MTRKEAIRRAKEKCIELWGEEWVRENADHICGSLDTLANYMCEIAIVESTPRPLEYYPTGEPKIWMGGDLNSKPNHRTVFLFDLKAGTMEITEHF